MEFIKSTFTVSEVAKVFNVKTETVKQWLHKFSDYLSKSAIAEKGKTKLILIEDFRVLAYINYYWEDNPDIENITYGLNSNSHFDNELIENLISSLKPLFQGLPQEIDETWDGVVFGGEFELDDIFNTARSYKLAGDKLIETTKDNEDERLLFQPAIYNYRHSTELYLKSVIGIEKSHNLKELDRKFKNYLKKEFGFETPDWYDKIIESFSYADPNGTAFRYGVNVSSEILYADMNHIKKLMNWLEMLFVNVRKAQSEKLNIL